MLIDLLFSKEKTMSEKVNSLVKNIFETIIELKKIEPDYTWRNYLGDYGEYIAIKKYDLIKAPTNTKSYDATTKEGKTVQIKSVNTGTNIKLKKGKIDLLLVMKINDDASVETIYFNDFNKVKNYLKLSPYSNRFLISISKLKEIAK